MQIFECNEMKRKKVLTSRSAEINPRSEKKKTLAHIEKVLKNVLLKYTSYWLVLI